MTGITQPGRSANEPVKGPSDVGPARKSMGKDSFDAFTDEAQKQLPDTSQTKKWQPLKARNRQETPVLRPSRQSAISSTQELDAISKLALEAMDDSSSIDYDTQGGEHSLSRSEEFEAIVKDIEAKENAPTKFLGVHRVGKKAKPNAERVQEAAKVAPEKIEPIQSKDTAAAVTGQGPVIQRAVALVATKGKGFLENILKPNNTIESDCRNRLKVLSQVEIAAVLPNELPATEEDLYAATLLLKMIDIPNNQALLKEFGEQASLSQDLLLTIYSEHISDAELFNGMSLVMHSAAPSPSAHSIVVEQKVKIWEFATKWLHENSDSLLKNKEALRALYSAVASGLESKDPEVHSAADTFQRKLSEAVQNQKELRHSVPVSKTQGAPAEHLRALEEEFDVIVAQKIGGDPYKERCKAWCADITRAFAESKSQLTRNELILTPANYTAKRPEGVAPKQAEAQAKIPNLLAMTKKFDTMGHKMQDLLLHAADPEKQGSPAKYCAARCFIMDIALELAKQNDLDGVYVIAAALGSPTVTKLDKTMFGLLQNDDPAKVQYEKRVEAYEKKITSLMSTSLNQKNMRDKAQAAHVPIPYNLFAKDQFGIAENNTKDLQNPTQPNPELPNATIPNYNRADLFAKLVSPFMADIPRAQKIAQQPIQSSLGKYIEDGLPPSSENARIARIDEIRTGRPSAKAAPLKVRPTRPAPPPPRPPGENNK